MKTHEQQAFLALHKWRVMDPSLTRDKVQKKIDDCLGRTSGAFAGQRLLAIRDWADDFIWDS